MSTVNDELAAKVGEGSWVASEYDKRHGTYGSKGPLTRPCEGLPKKLDQSKSTVSPFGGVKE